MSTARSRTPRDERRLIFEHRCLPAIEWISFSFPTDKVQRNGGCICHFNYIGYNWHIRAHIFIRRTGSQLTRKRERENRRREREREREKNTNKGIVSLIKKEGERERVRQDKTYIHVSVCGTWLIYILVLYTSELYQNISSCASRSLNVRIISK